MPNKKIYFDGYWYMCSENTAVLVEELVARAENLKESGEYTRAEMVEDMVTDILDRAIRDYEAYAV